MNPQPPQQPRLQVLQEKLIDMARFPLFLATVVGQLLYYGTTEPETFFLFCFSITIGFLTGWAWGLAVFFGLYYLSRQIGSNVAFLASKFHIIAMVMDKQLGFELEDRNLLPPKE